MGEWHREHPELCGTAADPWTRHESYRRAVREVRAIQGTCQDCGDPICRGRCEAEGDDPSP